MNDGYDKYEAGPLVPNERQRVRRDFGRNDALWQIFGPITTLLRDWKFWTAALAILGWMNKPEIAQALQVLIGGGQ